MTIILTILGTLTFDWIGGVILTRIRKNKLQQKEDIFISNLENILNRRDTPKSDLIGEAMKLCRHTEGKAAFGAYMALDNIKYI